MNFCSAVSRSAKLEPRPDCMAMFHRSRCNAHLSFHVAHWATDGEYSFLMDQLLSLPSPPGPRAPGLRSGPSGSVAGEHRFHQVWLKWLKFAQVCKHLRRRPIRHNPIHKYPSLRGGVTECLGVFICLLTPPVGHRPPSLPREKTRNDCFAWTKSKT